MRTPPRTVTRPFVLGDVADDGVPDGVGVVEGVGLVEHPDADAAAHGDPAGVRFQSPAEHCQQTGFAVAVAADDADPVALLDPDRQRIENHAGRKFQMQGFGPQ